MAESYAAFVWIKSEATADSALVAAASGGIYQGLAPLGVITPFMSFNRQAGTDVNTVNQLRIYASILLQIKMVGPSSAYETLEAGALRIDALFANRRNVGLPGSGGGVASYRESGMGQEEPKRINRGQHWPSGGPFRIRVKGSEK